MKNQKIVIYTSLLCALTRIMKHGYLCSSGVLSHLFCLTHLHFQTRLNAVMALRVSHLSIYNHQNQQHKHL